LALAKERSAHPRTLRQVQRAGRASPPQGSCGGSGALGREAAPGPRGFRCLPV
jgi:hypothetical protein